MKIITLYWQGKEYRFDPQAGWPEEVQPLFGQKQDPDLCSFGPWQCPRPAVRNLCGGLPTKKKVYPFWLVLSRFPKTPRKPAPGAQLSFVDTLYPPSSGWLATYYCARGAAWHEGNEKSMGATSVIVQKVSKIKRKIKKYIVDFSDVLNLGCERS